jgi:hypothetical protein
MPTALTRILLGLLLLLPLVASANETDAFVAANPAKQAKLLQDWAAAPTPERLPTPTSAPLSTRPAPGRPPTAKRSPMARRANCA